MIRYPSSLAQAIVLIGILFCSERSFGQREEVAIDQLFSRWSNSTPGVSVAVKLGDSVIYHKGFGLADLEHNVPMTPSTILESGSVAKQFTAMSILLLASEGKLSLNDDVRKLSRHLVFVIRNGLNIRVDVKSASDIPDTRSTMLTKRE